MRVYVGLSKWSVLVIPCVVLAPTRIKKQYVMQSPEMLTALLGIVVRGLTLPNNFIDEVVLPKDHIQHHLHIMRGMPVAMVVKRARFLQNTRNLDASRPHEVDIRLRRLVPILKRPLLLRLSQNTS